MQKHLIEVSGKVWTLTQHALERALDMGVDGCDIRQALVHPEKVRKSRKYPRTRLHDFRDITVAVWPGNVIRTILWRTDELWRRDLERGSYAGRNLRD